MIALLSDHRDAIAALCREYRVRHFDVFGSAATGTFDPDRSDVDFIVDLGVYERGVARRFLRLADALEELLGRPVDLVTVPSIVNPYFRAARAYAPVAHEPERTPLR